MAPISHVLSPGRLVISAGNSMLDGLGRLGLRVSSFGFWVLGLRGCFRLLQCLHRLTGLGSGEVLVYSGYASYGC